MTTSSSLATAYCQAAPWSPQALQLPHVLISLDHLAFSMSGGPRDATRLLWHAVEPAVQRRSPGTSLTTLELMRDSLWFGTPPRPRSLTEHLVRLAQQFLVDDGGVPTLQEPRHSNVTAHDLAVHWRWLSLLLPADLLVAARASHLASSYSVDTPRIASRQLWQRLSFQSTTSAGAHLRTPSILEGVAETHLHGNAALSFSRLWSNWLQTLHEVGVTQVPEDPVPPPQGSIAALRALATCAAVIRFAIASFLATPESDPSKAVATSSRSRWHRWFRWQLPGQPTTNSRRRTVFPVGGTALYESEVFDLAAYAYKSVRAGRLLDPSVESELHTHALPLMLRAIKQQTADRLSTPDSLVAITTVDPISPYFQATSTRSEETAFTHAALRYMRQEEENRRRDTEFEAIFWQYVRFRVSVFQYITQEPGTRGLDWFSRFDRRTTLFRSTAGYNARIEQGVGNDGADIGLRSYEPRFVPESNAQSALEMVRGLLDDALRTKKNALCEQRDASWEFGFVLHFIKAHRVPSPSPGASGEHADPRESDGLAYSGWIQSAQTQLDTLRWLLEEYPELLLVVRGIDLAGRELAMPLWPAVPVLRAAREHSIRAANRACQQFPTLGIQPLRVTVHAGEDYRHLAEGLRRVHECIESGVVRRGDRIGHAIALGDSPARWQHREQPCLVPKIERLDDLLWELDRYWQKDLEPQGGRISRIEHEIAVLSEDIYGRVHSSVALVSARQLRWDAYHLNSVGFAQVDTSGSPVLTPALGAIKVLYEHVHSQRVFERGKEPATVTYDDSEIAFLQSAQQWLQRRVSELEITVESNPSSNLLIAQYSDLTQHPWFRLLPLLPGPMDEQVLLSLNSDDPIVFASRLADEYAYAFNAIRRAGYSTPVALEWLDRVRANGMSSRFTLPWSASTCVLTWLRQRIAATAGTSCCGQLNHVPGGVCPLRRLLPS